MTREQVRWEEWDYAKRDLLKISANYPISESEQLRMLEALQAAYYPELHKATLAA